MTVNKYEQIFTNGGGTMLFLGTGASEMIPNPMCGCPVCRQALHSPDPREKRCRSAALFDDATLIDCGPDVISACVRYGASLEGLKRLFLTHTHSDHFCDATLENLQMCITEAPRLEVFLSKAAWNGLRAHWEAMERQAPVLFKKLYGRWPGYCTFTPMELYTDYALDDMVVSAVEGRHSGFYEGENSLNYLFRKDGRTTFYACDTGRFFPETFEYLKSFRLDCLVVELAFGLATLPYDAKHMTLESLRETLEQLKAQGTIDEHTQILATHIGHKGGLLHEACDEALRSIWSGDIRTAYDGLQI